MIKKIVLLMALAFSLGTAAIQAADPGPLPQCLPCDPSGSGN